MIPVTTRVGQGAAQVFDINQFVGRMFQMKQMQAQRQQQEQQQIAKIIASVDSEGIRTDDMGEFTQMYKDLQNHFISNPGIYSRPMDNIDAYKAGQQKLQRINTFIAESKEQKAHIIDTGKWMQKDRDDFEEESVSLYQKVTSMPTSKIKELTGGSLFNSTHVQFRPKPIKWDDKQKELELIADGTNTSRLETISEKHSADNGIPLGRVRVTTRKVFDPVATGTAVDGWMTADPNFRRTFVREFKASSPEDIQAMQQQLNTRHGSKAFEIKDAESFAKAYVALNHSQTKGDVRYEADQAFEAAQDERKRKLAQQDRLSAIYIQDDLRTKRDKDKQANKPEKEDRLLTDARIFIDAAKSGDAKALENAAIPLYKSALGMARDIEKIDPSMANMTETRYYNAIRQANAKLKTDMHKMTEAEMKQSWNKKVPIIQMTYKGEKDKNTTILINPLRKTATSVMYSIMKEVGGTKKDGLGDGYEGYEKE